MEPEQHLPEDQYAPLRRKAYRVLARRLEETGQLAEPSPKELRSLIHELSVYQIELEIENEELRRVQQDLQTTRDLLADLYDYAPVGYFTLDRSGIIQRANYTGASFIEMNRRDLVGKPLTRFITPAAQVAFMAFQTQVFESGLRQSLELTMIRKDKSLFHARLDGISSPSVSAQNPECRLTLIDISDRVSLERKLKANELHYQAVISSIVEVPITLDVHGVVVTADQKIKALVGRDLAELRTQQLGNLHFLLHEEDSIALTRALAALSANSTPVNMAVRLRHEDGHWVMLRMRGQPIADELGHLQMDGILTADS